MTFDQIIGFQYATRKKRNDDLFELLQVALMAERGDKQSIAKFMKSLGQNG
jgi:hypothetical protein